MQTPRHTTVHVSVYPSSLFSVHMNLFSKNTFYTLVSNLTLYQMNSCTFYAIPLCQENNKLKQVIFTI